MGIHYDAMIRFCRESDDISKAVALMAWDQETQMPPKGVPSRARQMATLSGLAHRTFTSEAMGSAILGAEGEGLGGPAAVNLREERRRPYQRMTKVPVVGLVQELAETAAQAKEHWRSGPKTTSPLRPDLEAYDRTQATIRGCRRLCARVVYDALLDDYEPGMTCARLTLIFADLRERLRPIVAKIGACRTPPRTDFLKRSYPLPKQEELSRQVLKAMGFDFEAGRMDVSTHPFTTSFAPTDVRVTTRFDEHSSPARSSEPCMRGDTRSTTRVCCPRHEGTPMGDASASASTNRSPVCGRIIVGAEQAVLAFLLPRGQKPFPEGLGDASTVDEFYRAREPERKPSNSSGWRPTRSTTTCTSCSGSKSSGI